MERTLTLKLRMPKHKAKKKASVLGLETALTFGATLLSATRDDERPASKTLQQLLATYSGDEESVAQVHGDIKAAYQLGRSEQPVSPAATDGEIIALWLAIDKTTVEHPIVKFARAILPRGSVSPASQVNAELLEALRRLEAANNTVCNLRTSEQYQSLINAGQQDALIELDGARSKARATLDRAEALPAPAVSPWQPISTYPQCNSCDNPDCTWGPRVLLLLRGRNHDVVVHGSKEDGNWLIFDGNYDGCFETPFSDPVAWMPLLSFSLANKAP